MKIIKNKFLADLAKNVEETKTEEQKIVEVLSNFDFEGNEFSESEKRFVQERERILIVECKKNRDSLFRICMTLQEMSDFFKNNKERKFMAWYQSAGFSKDLVSAYLKRADLYIDFPDKKDLISSLPNKAVKLLTNQLISKEKQSEVLSLGYTAIADIKSSLVLEEPKNLIDVPSKFRYFNPKSIDKIHKDVKKMSYKELMDTKKELEYQKKLISETIRELGILEKERENEGSPKLLEVGQ
ncbi:hypothetical protein [Cetobacterium sp.]|uniref:hypothetical protein n=1 Tax=Cetobacterium sp. TaxID=2071632 RepID=UPI003F31A562